MPIDLLAFLILAGLVAGGAVAAMTLRNLVHCALALALALTGLAGVYLQLEAQFVGFAQILVYVGAVAILIVFAILLTKGGGPARQPMFASGWLSGLAIAVGVFGLIAGVLLSSDALRRLRPKSVHVSVRQLGDQLMTQYVLPLEIMGLLLTVALIGAVIIAMRHGPEEPGNSLAGAKGRDRDPNSQLPPVAAQSKAEESPA